MREPAPPGGNQLESHARQCKAVVLHLETCCHPGLHMSPITLHIHAVCSRSEGKPFRAVFSHSLVDLALGKPTLRVRGAGGGSSAPAGCWRHLVLQRRSGSARTSELGFRASAALLSPTPTLLFKNFTARHLANIGKFLCLAVFEE